jgi:hypothetical protein
MKPLFIAFVLLLLLPSVADSSKRNNRVHVMDYTNSAVVAETVDNFNDIMPRGGPRLVYWGMPHASCENITVCVDPNLVEFAGMAYIDKKRIKINPDYRNNENVMCHEFMHILTRVSDAYNTNPDSCVYGYLDDPGGADIALLRERYQRKKR